MCGSPLHSCADCTFGSALEPRTFAGVQVLRAVSAAMSLCSILDFRFERVAKGRRSVFILIEDGAAYGRVVYLFLCRLIVYKY